MISIVIPLYNKESQIANTLLSVLAQTYQDFEVVIVDDGSTDGSVAEVQKIQDQRIRIISQKNAGVSAARNRGIAEAKGEYIAFLDADDEWKPDYLAAQAALIEKYPDYKVFATNYEFRNASGLVRPTILKGLEINDSGILGNYFEVSAISHPPLWTSAVMVEKKAIESVGGFPEGIRSGEDLITWARLACNYKIAYDKRPMAIYCYDESMLDDDQKSRVPEREDYVGCNLRKLMEEHPEMPGLKKYIGQWHKIRSRSYLTLGYRRQAFGECLKSLRYGFNSKILVFMALCAMPRPLIRRAFGKFSHA